jgi:hypothetical protein
MAQTTGDRKRPREAGNTAPAIGHRLFCHQQAPERRRARGTCLRALKDTLTSSTRNTVPAISHPLLCVPG